MATRTRLTLELSDRLNAHVEELAKDLDVSKADVLRLGVEALLAAGRAKRDGMIVGAWKEDAGRRVERQFL